MSNILTFDCLPNELIICIFGYLEPADNFQSFFHYNDRLRKLVKCYVNYSRRALDNDIKRFSTLHSWYKHLSFDEGGVTFYMMPFKGEQERYGFDPCVYDFDGIHWYFSCRTTMPLADQRVEQISLKYPIKLNPLFYPRASSCRSGIQNGLDFVRQYYPSKYEDFKDTLIRESFICFYEDSNSNTEDRRALAKFILENEPKRLRDTIQEAARHIWKEIQVLEDVNILEMKCRQ